MSFTADHAVGILFLAAGGVATFLGYGYGFGSLAEMGPGALPVLLGATLAVFGIVLLLRAMAAGGAAAISLMPAREVRPFVMILAALAAFGMLIDRVGLLPSLSALIVIGWFADTRGRLRELLPLALSIAAIILAIFYYGLGIPFRLVDWSF